MTKKIIAIGMILSVLLVSGCNKAEEQKSEEKPAEKQENTIVEEKDENKSSGGGSSFSDIGKNEISLQTVDPVKPVDVDFNFEVSYVPSITPIEAYKPVDARIHFETPDEFLNINLTEAERKKLEGMDKQEIEKIIIKKTDLLNDLMKAFKQAGISVSVDTVSGEMVMDSTVLFDTDKYEVSSEGKKILNKFLSAYVPVILKDKYNGFVSNILIEGHTDTNGSRDYNQKLSQNRADSVKKYCSSSSTSLSDSQRNKVVPMFAAVGYSFDHPIKDASGNVDMKASRRVAFRFLINLD